MVKFNPEPYIQFVQEILSEEFKEPAVKFRKVSEKIITELKNNTEKQVKAKVKSLQLKETI